MTAIVTGVKSKSLLTKTGREESSDELPMAATSSIAGEEMELI